MAVRTHTFRLGRYRIHEDAPLDGLCELPGDEGPLNISILPGGGYRALASLLEETMHAEGIPDRYVHGGAPDRIARLAVRLGWNR